ncbi:Sterol uptake control 2 [Fusarium albosuccineum]|uniref:Sterol uptake control 2 n=1 Tax=Fusarium albosuccineum TaxID=1237068 RepID=A0A8H4LF41_9HYPO|nr:Sterol uptake control 2 [Fusarium albosuccineum]
MLPHAAPADRHSEGRIRSPGTAVATASSVESRNCSRLSISCALDAAHTATATSIESTTASPATAAPRKRGRPLKWTPASLEASNPDSSPTSVDPSHSPSQVANYSPSLLNVDDLYLFHHYITTASLTLGDDVLWRDKVPRLAFENHFILHLMLALSALHLARHRVMESSRYEQLAEGHHSIALREVTDLLPKISRKNCSALYIATVLVCNYTFAKRPSKGHLLVVADRTEVAWWNIFRGVRFVIETVGLPAIFSGPLGPFPPENNTKVPEGEGAYIPWEEPLANLNTLILSSQKPGIENLATICEALASCFHEVYGTAEKPEDETHGKMHVVMRWLWFLEDDFIKQVKEMIPETLVLLAYFAVLLETLECFWFMRGWAHHVMDGILEHLDPDYIAWISWPRSLIGPRCDDSLPPLR